MFTKIEQGPGIAETKHRNNDSKTVREKFGAESIDNRAVQKIEQCMDKTQDSEAAQGINSNQDKTMNERGKAGVFEIVMLREKVR
jgi:hypothetical protein